MTNSRSIPLFGVRKFAANLLQELDGAIRQRDDALSQLRELEGLSLIEVKSKKEQAQLELNDLAAQKIELDNKLRSLHSLIVKTEDNVMLQEVGIYDYFHPLSDAVSYQSKLADLQDRIKTENKKDGRAITSTTSWTVNGSEAQGRAMVRDISKLMLRAFNAEADNLVRGLKPFKVHAAIDRLNKVAATIEKLGKTMSIRVSKDYLNLRTLELELTADFLQKQSEEKEQERAARERLKEERKAQAEMEREKAKLEKERQHYINAIAALTEKGDLAAIERIKEQLSDVERAIQDVDYRAANIRAGYVYVISNIGSFGESIVKIGMTRRLDPMDRIRELSDASVPFNFDVHALFFSNDAVGIETAMHSRLSSKRCNLINMRREFFYVTPAEAKSHLSELAGELLTFQDTAEAIEFRQSTSRRESTCSNQSAAS